MVAGQAFTGEGPDLAQLLSGGIAQAREKLPSRVAHEARRALFNVFGTALAASRHPACDALVSGAMQLGGQAALAPLGRFELLDRRWAACATGLCAHVDDFDDTHLATVVHPGAATLAVLWALQDELGARSERLLEAAALGMESQLRLAMAMTPWHYDRGWHITGTVGTVGACVTAALAMGCDPGGLRHSVALAARSMLGHREGFGSMLKGFHAGQAASNGLFAAQLVRAGARTGPVALWGEGALVQALSGDWDSRWIEQGWGDEWLLLENTYKPYPCGVVAHPGIEAAIETARKIGPLRASDISKVELRCNPLVPELMGELQPTSGLQGRFSAVHAVAVALLDSAASLGQFSDDRVRSEEVVALREKVTLVPEPERSRQSALLTLQMTDGGTHAEEVLEVLSSLARPLGDEQLEEKFLLLVSPVLGDAGAEAVAQAVWELGRGSELTDLAAMLSERIARPFSGARSERPRPSGDVAALEALGPEIRATPSAALAATLTGPSLQEEANRLAGELAALVASERGEPGPRADPDGLISAALALCPPAQTSFGSPGGRDGRSVPPHWVAFVNLLDRAQDRSPGDVPSAVTAVVVSAALAVAKACAAPEELLLRAVMGGLEVGARVSEALGDCPGWDPGAVSGRLAAATSTACLLGLDASGHVDALGGAATESSGLGDAPGSSRLFQLAKAAMDGVSAGYLAHSGLGGPPAPIEGRRGLLALLSSSPKPEMLTEGLGEVWVSERWLRER